MVRAAVAVSLLLVSARAEAYTIVDNDELVLRVSAWAQGGYVVTHAANDTDHQIYLGMARIQAEGIYKPWGGLFFQAEGLSGNVALLDIIAYFTPIEQVELRLGFYRTPHSLDQQIGAPFTPFVNRGLIFSENFVQKRLTGAELVGKLQSDSLLAHVQVGVFNANPEHLLPNENDGQFLSARAWLELTMGLRFHLAYIGLVHKDGGELSVPLAFNNTIDVGIWFLKDGWNAAFEGVFVADGPNDEAAYGGQVWLLKSFDLGDTDFDLEPGVRYDLIRAADVTTHRATVGLNLYIIGDFLNFSVNYEILILDDAETHTGYAQIQVGI